MSKPVRSDLDFGNVARIISLPTAVANGQPVVYEQLSSAIEGLAWKDNVRVATQSNINLSSPGATIDGITMSNGDRVLVKNQTTQPQNGIYIWNGSSSAMTRANDASTSDELESAVVSIDEGTDAGTQWRQTQVNFTLDSGNVLWTSFGASAPSASETVAGIAEIATQSETDTGTDDARFITPLKLATWSGRIRKVTANIGDGAATQYDVSHNLGTRIVEVAVFRNASPWEDIMCDVSRPDTNTVRLNFASAPTTNQFTVVVVG